MRNGAFVLTGYEDIVKEYHLTCEICLVLKKNFHHRIKEILWV